MFNNILDSLLIEAGLELNNFLYMMDMGSFLDLKFTTDNRVVSAKMLDTLRVNSTG